jgi:hypothetical protein
VRGAAIARFELVRVVLCAHKSGDGVSARRALKDVGLDDAADNGRGMGLNSEALAFNSRGEESGEAGKLADRWD